MARLTFKPGIRFQLSGEWYIVREILLDRKIVVESQSFGGSTIKSLEELEKAFADGIFRFETPGPHRKKSADDFIPVDYSIHDFDSLPDFVRDEAWRRYQLIRPILSWPSAERNRRNIEKYVNDLRGEPNAVIVKPITEKRASPRKGKKRGAALSRSSIERWLIRYRDSGQDLRSLVDETHKAGRPGFKRLSPDIDNIITHVLNECEKNQHYRTVESIYLMVVNQIAMENRTYPEDRKLELPSRQTIYNRIRDRGSETLLRRRRSRVERQSSEPVKMGPRPTRIMERVEFDGTWLDLILVDENDRLPIGRPFISFALDKYSDYPLGLYVGFEPPSYKTTMSCAFHAFSLKPDMKQLYGTRNAWFARGLPELAVIDNGKEYVNRHLLEAFGTLGIQVDQCPVHTPWFKASIERFFKTNNTGFIHALPGSTFSNIIDRGDYNSAKYACISLSGFTRMLYTFWLDEYAQRWNDGVKGIPEKLWLDSERAGFIPSFSATLDELKILLFWNDTRTLQRHGIEFENIVYQDSDLVRLRSLLAHDEQRVQIRVNPDDISCIYVLDPISNSEWLKFNANDSSGYTQGLSLWKHRAIQKSLNQQKQQVDIFSLAEAKARIQQLVEDEFTTTKKIRHRKKAARFLGAKPSASTLEGNIPSEGISLAPSLATNQNRLPTSLPDNLTENTEETENSRKTKSKGRKESNQVQDLRTSEDEDIDSAGWGGDYGLPQPKPRK